MAQVIFNRQAGERSAKELSFQVEDPSEKIRAQGLNILRGWEKKSQYDREQSREILSALKENANIEEQYRAKAFNAHLQDNQRVRDNILHNYKVDVKNLNQEADNVQRKYKALADLTTSVPKVIKETQRLRKEAAKKRVREDQESADNPEKPPESEEVQKVLTEEDKKIKQDRLDLITQGHSPTVAYKWSGYSALEKRMAMEILAEKQAPSALSRFNSQGDVGVPVYTPQSGGDKIGISIARIGIDKLDGEAKYAQQARLFNESNHTFSKWVEETYGIKGENYRKYFRPLLAKDHDQWVRSSGKKDEVRSKRRQHKENYEHNIGFHFSYATRPITSGGLGKNYTDGMAYAHKVFMGGILKGQTKKQRQQQFDTALISGIYARAINADQAKAYVNNTQVEPLQWKDKNDKLEATGGTRLTQSIKQAFPRAANSILEAVKVVQEEDYKEKQAELKRIQLEQDLEFEATVQEMIQMVGDNPRLNKADIIKHFFGESGEDPNSVANKRLWRPELAKRVQRYIQDNAITVNQKNGPMVLEDFYRLLWRGEINDEWIQTQKVPPRLKTELTKTYESFSGSAMYKGKREGMKKVDQIFDGHIKAEGQTALIDWRWSKKIDKAKSIITKEALELYPTFHTKGVSRQEALAQAYEVATKKYLDRTDWDKKDIDGTFWSAARVSKRDVPGVSQPQVYEITRDPVDVAVEDLNSAGSWSKWSVDGKSPTNMNIMLSDILDLKKSLKTGEPFVPSVYTQRAAEKLGMTPEKFVYLNAEKFDINDAEETKDKTDSKFNLKWEDSELGKAEKILADMSPSIRALWPDQLPDKKATEVVWAYQVLDQLGYGYGDVGTLLQDPKFKHLVSDAVKRILEKRKAREEANK